MDETPDQMTVEIVLWAGMRGSEQYEVGVLRVPVQIFYAHKGETFVRAMSEGLGIGLKRMEQLLDEGSEQAQVLVDRQATPHPFEPDEESEFCAWCAGNTSLACHSVDEAD